MFAFAENDLQNLKMQLSAHESLFSAAHRSSFAACFYSTVLTDRLKSSCRPCSVRTHAEGAGESERLGSVPIQGNVGDIRQEEETLWKSRGGKEEEERTEGEEGGTESYEWKERKGSNREESNDLLSLLIKLKPPKGRTRITHAGLNDQSSL